MAAYGWRTDSSIEEWLFHEGYRFDFYQAVKLLEARRPEAVAVGEGSEPDREPVRFRSSVESTFAPSDVADVEHPKRPLMTVRFLGLAGATGPLPPPFTEMIQDRLRQRDTAARDFLDIFNHRLISLMFRLRRRHRLGLARHNPETHNFTAYLFALMGLETPGLRGRMRIPDRALLRYTGLLAQRNRSMAGMVTFIADFLGVRIKARPFQGAWRTLDVEQQTAIGLGGRNQVLGQDAVLGGRLWDQAAGFELKIGPVPYPQFIDLLPSGKGFLSLCQLVHFYAGPTFDFGLRLCARAEDVCLTRLSATEGPALGWTSWLSSGAPLSGEVEVHIASVAKFNHANHANNHAAHPSHSSEAR